MRVLQLCSYYYGSTLYRSLFENIDRLNVDQQVSVFTKKKSQQNSMDLSLNNGSFKSLGIWNIIDRLSYFNKIKKAATIVNKNCDIIHAHTLYSDGGIAYEIYKKYKTPYIVAIRNTDIHIFYKYRLDLRNYGLEILLNADRIIFISPSYQRKIIKIVPKKIIEKINSKFVVIPNGLDDFWINNSTSKKDIKRNLVYFGEITKNKNIEHSIRAFHSLKKELVLNKFFVIGFSNKSRYELKLKRKLSKFEDVILKDKMDRDSLLKMLFECDIFLMPSKHETFGLVFLEAMSQSIPIIYTKDEGIDGVFNDLVGEPVEYDNLNDLKRSIKKIYANYALYQINLVKSLEYFEWQSIATQYLCLYKELMMKNETNIAE